MKTFNSFWKRVNKYLLNFISLATLLSTISVNFHCGKTMTTEDYVKGKFLPTLGIQSVMVTDLVTVQVQFNDSLESVSAKNISNYSITDASGNSIPVYSSTVSGSDTVILGTAFLGNVSQYTLTVKNVAGTGATQAIPADGITAVFTGLGADSPQFGIQTVNVKDLVTLQVKFNDTLDQASATTPANYTIYDPSSIGIPITSVGMAPNSLDTVLITTGYLSSTQNYTLNVKNVFGTGVKLPLSSAGATITFPGLGSASPQFGIQTVAVNSLNTLTIKFNDALDVIANNAATTVSNYTILDSVGTPVSITAATYNALLPDTIVLSTGYLSSVANYTLTVKNVKGVSIMLPLPASGAVITFPGMGSASPALGIKSLQVIDLITLRVEFNSSIDTISAQTAANYAIADPLAANIPVQSATMVPGSLTMVDIKTANSVASYLSSASNYTLTVKNVASTGVMLPLPVAGVSMTFPGLGSASPQMGLQSVAMVAQNVLEIAYNYAIDNASATSATKYAVSDISVPATPVPIGITGVQRKTGSTNTVLLNLAANLSTGIPYSLKVTMINPDLNVVALPIGVAGSTLLFTGTTISVVTGSTSPPVFLTPLDTATTGVNVQVIWTSISLAFNYTLDVCADVLCAQPVTNLGVNGTAGQVSPISILAPTTSASLTLPSSGTYYLKIRSNLTVGNPTAISINALDNNIYVYCPAATNPCSDVGVVGNISKPYQTIAGAMSAAVSLGKKDVRIASRDAGGTAYTETFMIKDGINLHGGYNATFTTQDMVNNKTVVNTTGSMVVFGRDVFQPTLIEGFVFGNTGTLDLSMAVKLDNCTGSLQFNKVTFNGQNVSKSNVTTPVTVSSYAMYLTGSSPTITNSTINSGSITINTASVAGSLINTYGIYNTNMSSPTITANIINTGNINKTLETALVPSYSTGIFNTGNSSPIINNLNVINLGNIVHDTASYTNDYNGSRVYGIYNELGSMPTISANTINGPVTTPVVLISNLSWANSANICRGEVIYSQFPDVNSPCYFMATGIYNKGVSNTISANTFNGRNGVFFGILNRTTNATVSGNTFNYGGSSVMFGAYVWDNDNTTFLSNVFNAGNQTIADTSASFIGIWIGTFANYTPGILNYPQNYNVGINNISLNIFNMGNLTVNMATSRITTYPHQVEYAFINPRGYWYGANPIGYFVPGNYNSSVNGSITSINANPGGMVNASIDLGTFAFTGTSGTYNITAANTAAATVATTRAAGGDIINISSAGTGTATLNDSGGRGTYNITPTGGTVNVTGQGGAVSPSVASNFIVNASGSSVVNLTANGASAGNSVINGANFNVTSAGTSNVSINAYAGSYVSNSTVTGSNFNVTNTSTNPVVIKSVGVKEIGSGNTINMGTSTGTGLITQTNYGIEVLNDWNYTVLKTNKINMGINAGGVNYGIYMKRFSNFRNWCADNFLEANVIDAGSAANTYGVYIDGYSQCNPTGTNISNNYLYRSATLKNNVINGGSGTTASYGVYISGTCPVVLATQSMCKIATVSSNIINGGSGPNSYGIYSAAIADVVTGVSSNLRIPAAGIFNNTIYSGTGANSYSVYNAGANSYYYNTVWPYPFGHAGIWNNTIHVKSATNGYAIYDATYSYADHLGVAKSLSACPDIYNNILYLEGAGAKYGIYEMDATSDPWVVFNNDFFNTGAGTFVPYYDFDNNCGGAGLGKNCTLAQMEALADIGNKGGNVALDPTFIAVPTAMVLPVRMDITVDGPDANTTYDGTTSTIEVGDCRDGKYVVGQFFEYSDDGIVRTISAVDCTATTSTITFTPALATASIAGKYIQLWGTNSTNFTDYQIQSTTACNVKQGGYNPASSSNFLDKVYNSPYPMYYTTDKTMFTRTATLTCAPTNTGAAGWSMGAYEIDN